MRAPYSLLNFAHTLCHLQTIFVYTEANTLSFVELGGLDIIIALLGVLILRAGCKIPIGKTYFSRISALYLYLFLRSQSDIGGALRSCFLFCATLSLLSPVLRTLTKSYADDTIWALAVIFACVHLISHDYCYVNSGIGR